jgi:hypothetical protein
MSTLENEPPSNKDLHNAVHAILKPFLSEVGVVQMVVEFSKWYIREDDHGSAFFKHEARAKFGDIVQRNVVGFCPSNFESTLQ